VWRRVDLVPKIDGDGNSILEDLGPIASEAYTSDHCSMLVEDELGPVLSVSSMQKSENWPFKQFC